MQQVLSSWLIWLKYIVKYKFKSISLEDISVVTEVVDHLPTDDCHP